jgi:hypothetical protein
MGLLFWKKKTPALTRDESLDAVVAPLSGVEPREDEKGLVTLVVPFQASPMVRKISGWLGAAPGAGERKIELDEVGSFVWRMFDGKTPVREMIRRLAEKHKLNRKDAEVSLTTFVRTLASRKLVAVVVRKNERGKSE